MNQVRWIAREFEQLLNFNQEITELKEAIEKLVEEGKILELL